MPYGIGGGIGAGLDAVGTNILDAQKTQRDRQLMQQQMEMQRLQMLKLKQETDPVMTYLGKASAVDAAVKMGMIPEEKAHAWYLKNLDATIETPEQAQLLNHAIGAYSQSGNPVMKGPLANPAQASPGLPEPPAPLAVSMNPRQYDLWSKYNTKEPSLAQQLFLGNQRNETSKRNADVAAGARVASAGVLANGGRAEGIKMNAEQRIADSYDKVIGPYEKISDSADRVSRLIQDFKNKKPEALVPTDSMRAQLANDLAVLQTGKSTVSGTAAAKIDSLYGRANSLVHFFSGGPQPTITDADMKNMQNEVSALKGEAGRQHGQKFSEYINTVPDQMKSKIQARFDQAQKNRFSGSKTPLPPGVPPNALFSKSTGKYYDAVTRQEIVPQGR